MKTKENLVKEFSQMIEYLAYKKLGSVEELTKKRVGVSPIRVRYRVKSSGRKKTTWYCGVCGKFNVRVCRGDKYCRECGTKILWTKTE